MHKGYFPKNYVKPLVIVPNAPKPPPRPTRSLDPPVAEVAVTKLAENLSTKVNLVRGPSFSLKSCAAFDNLMELGFAVEVEDTGKPAKGDLIQKGMRVELNCCAKIWDGASTVTKEFANGTVSFVTGEGQVTAGLDAAMLKLRVGDKATITCSPMMAYGAAGNPPSVPPNSFVVFSVEVLSAASRAATAAAAAATQASSSEGTQMLLGSGIATTRKVKGTENRRDSRLILVDAATVGANGSATTGGSAGGSGVSTPAKPAKPSPEAGSGTSMYL